MSVRFRLEMEARKNEIPEEKPSPEESAAELARLAVEEYRRLLRQEEMQLRGEN